MVGFDPWVDATDAGGDIELEGLLADRIAAGGPMTFAEFMAHALYHPERGYYARSAERIGRHGDFVTSPEVHPVFGALVARQIAELRRCLGSPDRLRIVEPGAGNGTLARDLIAALGRLLPEVRVDYVIVEPHPAARSRQRETVGHAHVRWADGLGALPPDGATIVVSNEVIDAFPVHRVVVRDGRLREVYVGREPRRGFFDHEDEPSTPALPAYFEAIGRMPGEASFAEVNLDAMRWIRDVAAIVRQGFVLTFDYGGSAAEVYAPWRREGTLLCGFRHVPGQDPYVRVGRQDITAHVDFTTIVEVGRRHGLVPLGYESQARFLTALGIGEGLAAPGDGPLALERYAARRQSAIELLDPAGLGRIRVLLQGKGVEVAGASFTGFPEGPPDRV